MSKRIIGLVLSSYPLNLLKGYRRATCYLQTLRPQSAVTDFKKILALEPKNESVRAQLTTTQKLIRKIEFEKARRMLFQCLKTHQVLGNRGRGGG